MKKITAILALALTVFTLTGNAQDKMRPYGSIGISYDNQTVKKVFGAEIGCYDRETWFALVASGTDSKNVMGGLKVYRIIRQVLPSTVIYGYTAITSDYRKIPVVQVEPGLSLVWSLDKNWALQANLGTYFTNKVSINDNFPLQVGFCLNYFR